MARFSFLTLLTLSLVLQSCSAWARQDIVPGSRYTSARAAAMGDAALSLGDDGASGLFVNPALLARVGGPQVEGLNLSFYANAASAGMMSYDFYKMASLSSYLPALQSHPGEYAGAGFSLAPTAYMKGFAFGVLMNTQLGAVVQDDGSVRYRSLYQFIPSVGTGIRLAGGIVRIGYSLQWVNQASGDITVPQSADPLGYNQGLGQGAALSHNVGFSLTLPIRLLPSFNLVARNILDATFREFTLLPLARNTSGVPPSERTTYDASFSIQPKVRGGHHMNLMVVYRDLSNVSQVSYLGRLAAGAEINVRDRFYLRGGWGSGYPSAGLGLKQNRSEFSLSWFSEELGAGYHSLRDVRYLLQYQVRAF